MNQILDSKISVLSSAERIDYVRKISGLTQQEMADKIKILKLRSIQTILKKDTYLQANVYANLSLVFNIPEYQFFGELPKTYIFQCRKINDPNIFATVLQEFNIIDVKWNFPIVNKDLNDNIRKILKEIDSDDVMKNPIKEYIPERRKFYYNTYSEKFEKFENRKLLFDDVTNGTNAFSIYAIPVFAVVPIIIEKTSPSFVWQQGVAVHLLPVNSKDLPTHVDYVGDRMDYSDGEYSKMGYENYSLEALDKRPDLNNVARINFGDPNEELDNQKNLSK